MFGCPKIKPQRWRIPLLLPQIFTIFRLMKSYRIYLFIPISIVLAFCNRGPYAEANKNYKKQVKSLVRELRRNPSSQTMATAAAWVGTTNFNLRKPNIVVIHHTAQNSC